MQCLCDINENFQMSSFIRNLQGQEYLTGLDHSDFSYQHYFRIFYNAGVLLIRCLRVPCIVILTFTGVLVMTYYPDSHVNDVYSHLLARLKKKRKKNLVLSWFKLFRFYLSWHKQCGRLEKKHWIQFELSVTNLLSFQHMYVSMCIRASEREREREGTGFWNIWYECLENGPPPPLKRAMALYQ